jgi:hypothetical protein
MLRGSTDSKQVERTRKMPRGKDTDASLANQLIAGTRKHFANTASLTFAGATCTPAQVESLLQTIVDLRAAVEAAKASVAAKVTAEEAQRATRGDQMAAYVALVKATFAAPDVLADFGLKPKKAPTPPSTEKQAEAIAKRAATRAARHTMGSKAKKSVKGTVTTIVTSTPSTAEAPVATSPAPAPATPGTAGGTAPHATQGVR